MPTVSGRGVTIAASGNTGNVLEGTNYQFLSGPVVVNIWATSDDGTQVLADVKIGSDELIDGGQLNTVTANEIRLDQDKIVDRQVIMAQGVLLFVRFRNTDGVNPQTVNYQIQLDFA